jgi:hypothetical protein
MIFLLCSLTRAFGVLAATTIQCFPPKGLDRALEVNRLILKDFLRRHFPARRPLANTFGKHLANTPARLAPAAAQD